MNDLGSILSGFGSVAVVIAIGWILGRSGVLGDKGGPALNLVVYWVAMPALLIHTLATMDTGSAMGVTFVVAAASALLTACVYGVIARVLLRQRGPELVVGGMSSSYNNVANLGIPIAAAVLGDATAVVPSLVFQIAFYAPLCLTVLDFLTTSGKVNFLHTVSIPLKNPVFIGAMLGLLAYYIPYDMPQIVADPVSLLGQAAPPMALLAFGISLYGAPLLRKGVSPRRAVALSSGLKLIVHPLAAWAIAHFIFGFDGYALFAVTVVAALPTAQNVFTFASRFGRGTVQARDSGVVTTMLCLPVIITIAVLLG